MHLDLPLEKKRNMEIESLKTGSSISHDNRSFNNSAFTFDLPSLIESMKQSYSWSKGELSSMILLKNPEKQIVLTALHKGTEVDSYQSKDSVSIEILEGKLKFHTRREEITLGKGELFTLHEKIKYSLKTIEETVFLLTINNDSLNQADN